MSIFFPQIINELYYGETPDIKKLQDLISELREQAMNINVTRINTLDILKNINRHIEDMFGFKAFSLYINPSKLYNAFTFPISNKIDVWNERSKLKYDTRTLKYENNDYVVITYINSGVLLSKEFTDREIVALLLHEIGHSFTAGYRNNAIVSNSIKVINIAASIEQIIIGLYNGELDISLPLALSNNFSKISDIIEKAIRKNKILSISIDSFSYVGNMISQAIQEVLLFLSRLIIVNPGAIIFNIIARLQSVTPFSIINSFLSYRNEQLSDNFATVYGYGPDISSALSKMERLGGGYKVEEIFNKIPTIQQMYQVLTIPMSFLFHPLNSHPETVGRIKNQIDMLNNELKKNDLDIKVRKEIEKDLKEIERALDKYIKVASNPNSDPHLYNKLYSKFMLDKFNGDIRDKMFKTKSYHILDKK